MNLAAALALAIADATDVVVSRAASPELKAWLAGTRRIHEAPTVRGRTVWDAVPRDVACVETPNWWGRRETVPAARPAIVVDRRHDVVGSGGEDAPDPPEWRQRTELLRRCMRTAAQLVGVTSAHGGPEAPWAVLLLPVPAEAVAASCRRRGVAGVTALEPRVPELPGGLRLAVPDGAGSEWSATVVASITHEIERTGAP